MPTISLTDFVDFVIRVGPTKLTKVLEIKRRTNYLQRFDYYREIREGIIVFHAERGRDKRKYFASFLENLDTAKRSSFQLLADNYKSFLGHKEITSSPVERTTWKYKELKVRINPELSLNINDKHYLLKLYFKAPALTTSRVDVILLLMKHALPRQGETATSYGLLDVHHNRLYDRAPQDRLLPLLHGEADSFLTMWNEAKA
ncbi:MAG: hypothetical protein QOG23_231 [Blastocatellia bacterium]|jgi:hypothetical protein|nr:hypothetical protein [Blastocatellia bacterium]